MRKKLIFLTSVLLILFFVVVPLFARAGGAGGDDFGSSGDFGGGGGDDGGGGIFFLVYLIFRLIPFPFNIILLILLIGGGAILNKKNKGKSVLNSYTPTLRDNEGLILSNPVFTEKLSDFKSDDFKDKVRVSFLAIQDAWSRKDLSNVRKYITDGIYQRFMTQFLMMDILKQVNQLTNVIVESVTLVDWSPDGPYDVITVRIKARANDRFVSEVLPEMSSGGDESFTEFWSFIKKRGLLTKDLYRDPKCPGCGAEITGVAGGVSKCPYCKKLLNSGEYDWVLSEITQAADYIGIPVDNRKHLKLDEQIRLMEAENTDFAVQVLEDRASNVFLHLMTADTKNNLYHARRYVSDAYYKRIEEKGYILNKAKVFSRLYLNDVSLVAVGKRDGKNLLAVSIKQSGQLVDVTHTGYSLMNKTLVTRCWVLLLERDEMFSLPAGSVTAYSCPHCGGEFKDTADITCQYCKEPLNSTRFDWVVTDCLTLNDYDRFVQENPGVFEINLEPDPLIQLFKVRDFAMNNVMVMLASDGVFSPEEQVFAEKTGKKWGYDLKQLEGFLQLAAAGKLMIRMPEDRKMRERIFALMQKAVASDLSISPAEQNLLDSVKAAYLS